FPSCTPKAPKSRRPAWRRAFEGEKAHGHCAVGLELFPRRQFSGVLKPSQAGKPIFAFHSSLAFSLVYEKSTDVCNILHQRLLSVTVEVLCIDGFTRKP